MRVRGVRFGQLALAVATSGALVTLGVAPVSAAATPEAKPVARAAQQTLVIPKQSYKVTIYPAYSTAGMPTTFEVTVANISAPGTMLKSVQVSPPPGFTLSRPGPNAPLRNKTLVQRRTLSLRHISLKPGAKLQFDVNATAPKRCGNLTRHWTSHAFQGATPTGPQLSLQSASSNFSVTVVCPRTAVCGDGGPACSTNLPTSVSSYGVVSTASTGTLRGTIDVGRRLKCGAYQFHDSNWYDSVVTPPATPPPTASVVPIVDSVSYTIKNTTTQGLGFCLGANYDFATASGNQAPAAKLPTGATGFIGLLPMCTPATPPCISKISQKSDPSGGYDAVMTIVIPETGDPWGGG